MVENSLVAQDNVLRLSEEYSTPYNAIIRAHVVMGVSRYFLERWVPLLGTAPATIVNTLRQINYHTPQKAVAISGKRLAQEAAMSRRHLYTCLETPWLSAFIRVESGKRSRSETGKVSQEANRYHIRMDDPLTPADAEHLMLQLKQEADNPIAAANAVLDRSPRECWAPDLNHPAIHFENPEPVTAKVALERAFPNWEPCNENERLYFGRVAEALHRHLTLVRDDGKTSKIIVPQYFRTRWWPLLGHDLAWSYLWLRGAVYDNPDQGITRNTCWIPSLGTLLNLINRPREWWRRNVERKKTRAGGWAVSDFFEQLTTQKGHNPEQPQQVARKFLVRSELPVAPTDRATYSRLLIEWPDTFPGTLNTSARPRSSTLEHIGPTEVQHTGTHRPDRGPAHWNTPARPGSNTFKHTEILPLCHKRTHRSATSDHRESESYKALLKTSPFPSSKHKELRENVSRATAAAGINNDLESKNLAELISESLQKTPEKALCEIADVETWLCEAWSEPIDPHTPAWAIATTNQITQHELVALMLAVAADPSIKQPPRYTSWLLQQWQAQPQQPPVNQWERWKTLAELPLDQWKTKGKSEWLALSSDYRALPFGLETALFGLVPGVFDESQNDVMITAQTANTSLANYSAGTNKVNSNGLDHPIGDGKLTIHDFWRAALRQLSVKLQRSIYVNWIEGSQAIAYKEGVLTVRARHFMAREQLSQRFNPVIEETLSDLIKMPITIRYVL